MSRVSTEKATESDTPRTDDFCRAKYNAAMASAAGYSSAPEESPEQAYGDAVEWAKKLERELTACNDDWNKRYQQWGETEDRLRAEIKSLHRFKASVDDALNNGNGTYKP